MWDDKRRVQDRQVSDTTTTTNSTMASTTNYRWMSRYYLNFIRCSPTPRGCSSNVRFLMVSSSMCSVETEETDRMLARRQCSSVAVYSVTEWRGQHLPMRCLPRVKHSNVYRRRKKRWRRNCVTIQPLHWTQFKWLYCYIHVYAKPVCVLVSAALLFTSDIPLCE